MESRTPQQCCAKPTELLQDMNTTASYLDYYTNGHSMKPANDPHCTDQANKVTSCYEPRMMNYNRVPNEPPGPYNREIKVESHEKLTHCDIFRGKRRILFFLTVNLSHWFRFIYTGFLTSHIFDLYIRRTRIERCCFYK